MREENRRVRRKDVVESGRERCKLSPHSIAKLGGIDPRHPDSHTAYSTECSPINFEQFPISTREKRTCQMQGRTRESEDTSRDPRVSSKSCATHIFRPLLFAKTWRLLAVYFPDGHSSSMTANQEKTHVDTYLLVIRSTRILSPVYSRYCENSLKTFLFRNRGNCVFDVCSKFHPSRPMSLSISISLKSETR